MKVVFREVELFWGKNFQSILSSAFSFWSSKREGGCRRTSCLTWISQTWFCKYKLRSCSVWSSFHFYTCLFSDWSLNYSWDSPKTRTWNLSSVSYPKGKQTINKYTGRTKLQLGGPHPLQFRYWVLDLSPSPFLLQIWCNFFRHCCVVWGKKCNFLRIAPYINLWFECSAWWRVCGLLVFEGQTPNLIFSAFTWSFLSSTTLLVSDKMRYWNIYIQMSWEMCGNSLTQSARNLTTKQADSLIFKFSNLFLFHLDLIIMVGHWIFLNALTNASNV